MKAIVYRSASRNVKLEDISLAPNSNEVVEVKLKASALNHRDVWITKGLYPGLKDGIIQGSCGSGLYEGKRVLINPNYNWGPNPDYPDHSTYSILGMPINGTFAEVIQVDKDRIHEIPDHLNIEQAAALPLAGLTAYRALFSKGDLSPGDKVFISGIGGGVALMAFQFAVAYGAEVYVSSSSDEKINKAIALGAKGGVNYTSEDWALSFQDKYGGVDVIIDSAAGKAYGEFLKICNPQARIVNYGGTRGNAQFNPQILFWKEIQILGSTMGSDIEFSQMLDFVSSKRITPVIDSEFELEDFESAYIRMEKGEQFGKIILRISD